MKKLLVFLLILASNFALTSCKTPEKEPEEIEVQTFNVETYFAIKHAHKVVNNQFTIDVEVTPKDSVTGIIETVKFKLSFTYTYSYTQNGKVSEFSNLYEHVEIKIESLERIIASQTFNLEIPEGATFDNLTISQRTINPFLTAGKIKGYK